jgi:hypothetical protein
MPAKLLTKTLTRIVIVSVITANVINAPAHAERGWTLAANNSKESFYFSPDSVETTNDITEVSVVRNLHKPRQTPGGQIASVLDTLAVNCKSLRYTTTSTLFFKLSFARGERLEPEVKDRQGLPSLDQNLPPLFLMRVCGFSA